jgi:hypothetical protein
MNDIKGYFRLTSYWKQLPVLSFVSGSFHIGKDCEWYLPENLFKVFRFPLFISKYDVDG